MEDQPGMSDSLGIVVADLRGAFAEGRVTPELVRLAYEPLGRFLGWQPVAGWERLEADGRFAGAVSHYAVVGTVPFELPGVVRAYLFAGVGPEPSGWGAASTPSQTAEVWLRCVDADDSGLNQALWTEDIARRPRRPEVRLPGNIAPHLVAEADQLSTAQRERSDETMRLAQEALEAPEPPEGTDFWSA